MPAKPMPANAAAADLEARTLVLSRHFAAPPRLLFKAWSRCDYIKQWFGPVGWPVTLCEIDFRVGGRWRFAMTGASGKQNTPFGGSYREIVPDRRIVFDNTFEAPGAETMVMTVTFAASRGGTDMTLSTLFGSLKMRDEHVGGGFVEGTNSGWDQLVGVVATMATAANP